MTAATMQYGPVLMIPGALMSARPVSGPKVRDLWHVSL
jgi:hypothetical protein